MGGDGRSQKANTVGARRRGLPAAVDAIEEVEVMPTTKRWEAVLTARCDARVGRVAVSSRDAGLWRRSGEVSGEKVRVDEVVTRPRKPHYPAAVAPRRSL